MYARDKFYVPFMHSLMCINISIKITHFFCQFLAKFLIELVAISRQVNHVENVRKMDIYMMHVLGTLPKHVLHIIFEEA